MFDSVKYYCDVAKRDRDPIHFIVTLNWQKHILQSNKEYSVADCTVVRGSSELQSAISTDSMEKKSYANVLQCAQGTAVARSVDVEKPIKGVNIHMYPHAK